MRQKPAPVPKALLARARFGEPVFITVPETHIGWFQSLGWILVAKDSDVPRLTCAVDMNLLSGPRRVEDPPMADPEE